MYLDKLVNTKVELQKYKREILDCKDYNEILNKAYPTKLYLTLSGDLREIIKSEYIKVREDYFIKDESINYSPDIDYYYSRQDIAALFRFRGDNAIFSAMHTQTMIDMIKRKVKKAQLNKLTFADFISSFTLNEYEATNLHYIIHALKFSIKQTRLAGQWQNYQVQKDIYPYLQYKTGERCREKGLDIEFDNIVKPIDDKFWDKYFPLNNFGCDCKLVQLSEKDYSKLKYSDPAKNTRFKPSKGFARNVGKDFTLYCHWIDELFPDY